MCTRYINKHVLFCSREARDAATVDLPGFFLQIDHKIEDAVLLKITSADTSCLVKSDLKRWRNKSRRENGKFVSHSACDRNMHQDINVELISYKK